MPWLRGKGPGSPGRCTANPIPLSSSRRRTGWNPPPLQAGEDANTKLYDTLKTAAPYGAARAKVNVPAEKLDAQVEIGGFPVGHSNYPITGKLKITNRSATTIPGGAEFQWDYASSAPGTARDQSGYGLTVISSEHTASNNIGGLKGDFNRVSFKLRASEPLAPGASVTIDYVYYLPAPTPANFTVSFGGRTYGLTADYARGGVVVNPTPTPTGPTGGTGDCTAPAWSATQVYTGGARVSHRGRQWEARWWTQNNEPGTGDTWKDLGACSGATPHRDPDGDADRDPHGDADRRLPGVEGRNGLHARRPGHPRGRRLRVPSGAHRRGGLGTAERPRPLAAAALRPVRRSGAAGSEHDGCRGEAGEVAAGDLV
ncbi:chitinase C-terminal domain-containing protein [Streptosporangium sandarakinum]